MQLPDLDVLPPLSPRGMELLALRIDDDDAERRLLQILAGEPQLAARVVAIANSAAYGLPRVRFSTLPLAMRRIGLRRTLQLGTALLFGRPLSAGLPSEMRIRLWAHAIAVACAASELARLVHGPDPAEAYLAGLLHDLGYMLVELGARGTLAGIEARAAEQGLALEEAEFALLGTDHGALTAGLLRHWGVPAGLCEVYDRHHSPVSEPRAMPAVLLGAEKIARLDALADVLLEDDDWLFADSLLNADAVGCQLQQQLGLNGLEMTRIVDRVAAQAAEIAGLAGAMAAA